MKGSVRPPLGLVASVLIGVVACVWSARLMAAPSPIPSPAEKSGGTRVVELRKLVIRVPVSGSLGTLRSGLGCFSHKSISPDAGRNFLAEGELAAVFREEFSSAGYLVPDDPSALFEDTSDLRRDYLIGGVVHDLKADLCSRTSGFGATDRAKGEASLVVDWQVFSLRTRRVELSVTSRGGARLSNARDGGAVEVIREAFRAAARQALGSRPLRDLLESSPVVQAQPVAQEEPIVIALETAGRANKPTTESMLSDARLSVVTIIAGEAFGSGFVISPDGYLLTSQHVVGKARYLTVRFVTGREVNGEVIRVNAARDVALVKLENDLYRPLTLGNTRVLKVGTDVFAIGTPLSEDFGQTVTKGIISGFGEDGGQRMVRSDVGIHKGNSGGPLLIRTGEVVGIADGGVILMPLGAGVGLNSFVPIEEAIEALGIRGRQNGPDSQVEVAAKSGSPRN